MFTELYVNILSFCDERSKYRFGICSKECLTILHHTIKWNEEELNK